MRESRLQLRSLRIPDPDDEANGFQNSGGALEQRGAWDAIKVPLKGSPVLLLFSACVFLYGALAWGLYISAMFRNQLAAYQMGTLTSFLPAFLLSGFIYPISNMPWIIRVISFIIPARYFIDMSKGIFLKGTGLRLLWLDLLLLIVYAVGISFLAVRKLRQKIA